MTPTTNERNVTIPKPNIMTAAFSIRGTAPLVIHKFSAKAKKQMMDKHVLGSLAAKGKKVKEPRNFDQDFEGAKHLSEDGWCGIAAPAFRAAMISACRLVGFQMTKAKLSVFVIADGIDADDGTPLIRIQGGDPEKHTMHARNDDGTADIRCRPMWRKWTATVRVQWDGDQFKIDDVANLLARAGAQVGVGEGRPDSRNSCGMGWGTFSVEEKN